jgi:hypothetical protein
MGFTPSDIINRDFKKLKKKFGNKFATKYFKVADKLFNPNRRTVFEYRYAGLVTEDCGCYHFHAIAGFDYKLPYVSFVIDITEQFVS